MDMANFLTCKPTLTWLSWLHTMKNESCTSMSNSWSRIILAWRCYFLFSNIWKHGADSFFSILQVWPIVYEQMNKPMFIYTLNQSWTQFLSSTAQICRTLNYFHLQQPTLPSVKDEETIANMCVNSFKRMVCFLSLFFKCNVCMNLFYEYCRYLNIVASFSTWRNWLQRPFSVIVKENQETWILFWFLVKCWEVWGPTAGMIITLKFLKQIFFK